MPADVCHMRMLRSGRRNRRGCRIHFARDSCFEPHRVLPRVPRTDPLDILHVPKPALA
jgi:hypothetical protein